MAENVRPTCTCELTTAKFCPFSKSIGGKYVPIKDCATQERDLTRRGELEDQVVEKPEMSELARRFAEAKARKAAQG